MDLIGHLQLLGTQIGWIPLLMNFTLWQIALDVNYIVDSFI
jgi:hypothetical protein